MEPDINVTNIDLMGNRHLVLPHRVLHQHRLDPPSAQGVLRHLAVLWGDPVELVERDAETDRCFGSFESS